MANVPDTRDVSSELASEPLRLGGMALENGLLVYGPKHWAAAIRGNDGEIAVHSGLVPRVGRLGINVEQIPGLRGVARLAESLAVVPLVRYKLPQSRLPFESPKVIATGAATAALGTLARRRKKQSTLVDIGVSLVGMAPALISLRSGNVAAYHGVEHKAIAAYERGGDPTDADVIEAAAKEHERCGSHLVAPMMLTSVAGEAIARRLVERPGAIVQASIALAGAAASIEMFAYAERHPRSGFAKVFRRPGFELQKAVGTREPSAAQIEVGQAAIGALLAAEGVQQTSTRESAAAESPPPGNA